MRSDWSSSRSKSSTSSPPSSSLLEHQSDDTRRTEISSPEQQAAASTSLSHSSISFDPFHQSSLDRTSTCRALAIDCTRGKPVVVSGSASGEVTIQWPLKPRAKIPPILLPMGHSQAINAVALWVSPCFPQSEDAIAAAADEDEEPPALICSASKDLLTLGQLNESLTSIVATLWEFAPSRVSRCISFDPSGYLLCLGVGKTVIVLRARKGSTLARLEGHTGSILALRFDPQHPHICVSGSEDGTFKIWDLRSKACVYDCRTHTDPLVCLAFHPTNGILCTASSSGHLHLYRPISSAAAAEAVVSGSGEMMEIASSTVPAQATYSADQPSITSATVFDISFHHIPSSSAAGSPSSSSKEDLLIIATSDGILLADCRSRKVVSFASFSQGPFALACLDPEGHWVVYGEALSASCMLHGPLNRLTMSESTTGGRCGDGHGTSDGSKGSSPPSLEDAQNCHRDDEEEGYREGDGGGGNDPLDTMLGGRRRSRGSTSFFPSPAQEIPKNSPLQKDFFNRVTSAPKKGLAYDDYTPPPKSKASDGGAGKKQLPHDKPVVFHSRIRSSGYGSYPSSFDSSRGSSKSKQTGVRPAAAAAASAADSGGLSASAAAASSVKGRRGKARNSPGPLSKQYPTDCGPLIRHQEANDLPTSSSSASPLLHVAYGGDAQMLAAAALDGTIHLYRLPIAKHKGDGCTLVGHSLAVRHVSPSHDQGMVLTASDDGTARLWALGLSRKSPAVTIKPPPAVEGGSSSPSNSSPSATTNSSSSSIGLPPIPKASFFYLDKFALVASGRRLYLYQYQIDLLSKHALIRHQASPGKARIIHTWTHTNAQKITSFDCLNGVLSPYIVTACSNRSFSILDAAYGSIVRTLHEAHARPIHTVTLPRPSAYCALPSSASLDVFATAATDNVITVWDLRANMARAASFRDHLNRRETLGVALSPCMRYLATGSEDRAAYLYDLRNGRVVHRLQGHEDVVSSISFNPLHPQLATASYDGTLKFYTERDDGSGVS